MPGSRPGRSKSKTIFSPKAPYVIALDAVSFDKFDTINDRESRAEERPV